MCWMSWNLGATNFWNPQCLSRPLIVLLYILQLLVLFFSFPFFLNTFPVPLPSAQQVAVPETRLAPSLSHFNHLWSIPIRSPASALQPYCLHCSVMRWSSSTRCLLPASQPFGSSGSTSTRKCWPMQMKFRVSFRLIWSSGFHYRAECRSGYVRSKLYREHRMQ